MDHVKGEPPPRPLEDRIRHAARDAGILPSDPLAPLIEGLADLPREIDLRVAPVLKQLQAAQPGAVLTDKQVDDIGRRLLSSCEAWSWRLARTSLLRSWAAMAVTVLGAVGLGMGAGWWLHSPPSELTCADQQDGSRICWMYIRLPTAPAKHL